MKKENVKYLVIALVCIAALIALYFYLRYKSLKEDLEAAAANKPVSTSNTSGGGSSTTSTSTTTSTTGVIPAPYHGTDFTKWKKSDGIICKSGMANIYKTKNISGSNIAEAVSPSSIPFCFVISVDTISRFVNVKYVYINYFGFSSEETGYIYIPLTGSNLSN